MVLLLVGMVVAPGTLILGGWGSGVTTVTLVAPLHASGGSLPLTETSLPSKIPARPPSDDLPATSPVSESNPAATPRWTQLFPTAHPSPRAMSMMAYDAADGYVVLFGGLGGIYQQGDIDQYHCLNDTWTYHGGVWTNLSIPGPPQTCWGAMTYDAADGYVVAYLMRGPNPLGSPAFTMVNETWTFSHGKWTQVNTFEPPADDYWVAMTYDGVTQRVLMYCDCQSAIGTAVGQTWEYSEGTWDQITTATVPPPPLAGVELTFDAADGYPLLLAGPANTGPGSGATNGTWAFVDGNWMQEPVLPVPYDGQGALAYDSKDGYAIRFGVGSIEGGPTNWSSRQSLENATWLYSTQRWTDADIPGPTGPRALQAMTFDPADGYLLLFGGYWGGKVNNITSYLHNDTWIFTTPPVGVRLTVSASPHLICSAMSEDCGAATDGTRVSVGIAAVPVTGNESWGVDSGKGVVEYGPYYWVDLPTLTFVGWKNLTPAPDLSPSVSCGLGNDNPPSCGLRPSVVTLASGAEQLTWNWSNGSLSDALRVGDWWNLSFNVKALGPPFGSVPVDSCITAACTAVEDGPVDGVFASLGFTPWGNESRLADSLPLATVTVLPPLAQNSPPPGSSPPPPPPPSVVAPLPVTVPAPPTAVTAPTPVAVTAASAGSGASLTAVAAGLLGAGLTRVAVSRKSQAMRIANQVRMPNGGKQRPVRGND